MPFIQRLVYCVTHIFPLVPLGAEGRFKYIDILKESADKFKQRNFGCVEERESDVSHARAHARVCVILYTCVCMFSCLCYVYVCTLAFICTEFLCIVAQT